MPSFSTQRAFAQSLLVHIALWGLAFLLLSRSSWHPSLGKGSPHGPRTVEVSLQSGSQGTVKAARPNPARHFKKSGPSAHKNMALGLDFSVKAHSGGKSAGSPDPGGAGPSSPDGYDVANSMDLKKEGELYPYFRALWRKVDASTGYPEDFVKERITGTVTVQLVVDRRGVFGGQLVGISSDQPYLKTYVVALLFHALQEPLPRNLWADREEMIVVMRFDFRTFTQGERPPEPRFDSLKNVLAFNRSGYVDPLLNQVIDKIFTRYFPPIIPIPGAFYIDFIRAYQLIQNIRSDKLDEDGLRQTRLQLSREQWNGVVRSNR